jgi:hypothetical protein
VASRVLEEVIMRLIAKFLVCAAVIAVGMSWVSEKKWEVVIGPDGSKIMNRYDSAGNTLEKKEYRPDGSLEAHWFEDSNYMLRVVHYDRGDGIR